MVEARKNLEAIVIGDAEIVFVFTCTRMKERFGRERKRKNH